MADGEAGDPMSAAIAEDRATYTGNTALPYGSVTGKAKEIQRAIRQAAIGRALNCFLVALHEQSFGNAGWQQRTGHAEPGLTGPADIAFWRHELGWTRQRVWDIRQKAITLGCVTLIPNEDDPQHGRLRWNLDLATWLPLQEEYRRARYARPGAGRKSNVVQANQTQYTESNVVQFPAEIKSNVVQNVIKRSTATPAQPAPLLVASAPPKKEERVRKKETPSGVSSTASGDAPSVPKEKRLSKRSQAEAIYVTQLLDAVKAVTGRTGKLPAEAKERGHAGFFFTAGPDRTPAPIEDVVACYRILKVDDPFWRMQPVGMLKLSQFYGDYLRDRATFKADHAPKPASKPGQSGHARPEPPPQKFRTVRRGEVPPLGDF